MASLTVTNRFKYDVFLSFRGEDTRYGFTGYLKEALDVKGVRTFIDDEGLQKGDEITPSLLKAIEESMMAIVVLSENYASSSFCLQELSKILDTMKDKVGRSVFPVFYKVDPSVVRKLKMTYGEAMDKHKSSPNLDKWKDSLHQVANLSGSHYKGDEYESDFIKKIVELVLRNIKPIVLHVGDYLVGLEHQKQHLTSLLNVGSDDTIHMVGIYGIGGIGKTTLALEVYNSIVHQFQYFCVLEKVRENFDKNGLIYLQKILLSEIFGERNMEITSVGQGISILQKKLPQRKVLLLLDDVDKDEQLKAIAGSSDWFGPGSRVVITTRDKRLLTFHGVEKIYEVKGLNDEDAFDLVGWNALRNNYSPRYKDVLLEQKYGRELNVDELRRLEDLKNDKDFSDYANVLKRVVAYASGLPLALEVIGSHLFNKTIEQCKDALDRYERVPDKKIQRTLALSFDALEKEDQFVFLDIACCLRGFNLKRVEEILHAHHGHNMKHHIKVLVEKSLIKISKYGDVTLHDLIEDMGKEIVRQESPEDPGERTRLWAYEDLKKVFKEDTGTSNIKIILFPFEEEWEDLLDGKAFKKMKNLKTLIFRRCDYIYRTFEDIPNSLRVLVCSNGYYDSIYFQGWNEFLTKKFENMRVLNLDESNGLTKILDISGLPNLEVFSIQNCRTLIAIDKSVGFLRKLKILRFICCPGIKSVPPLSLASLEILDLSYCDNLESFPIMVNGFVGELKVLRVIECPKIRMIPPLMLHSLEELDLTDCTCLESFPLVVDGFGDKLKTISVRGCHNLRSIPHLKLDLLETLDLSDCYKLKSFPSVEDEFLGKLKTLLVENCYDLMSIPPLKLDSLETLDLSNCHNLISISTFKLDSLETLDLSNCNKLECFPSLLEGFHGKLKTLRFKHCHNLRSIPPLRMDSLETLDLSNCHNLISISTLKLDSLETLDLSNCHKLESFPSALEFHGKLKTLLFKNCHNLRSIPPLNMDSLETLDLSNCLNLMSISNLKLDSLETLDLSNCPNLMSISTLKLDSLETLDLSDCHKLESFPSVVEEFLGKLKTLLVKNCHNLMSIPPLKLDFLEKFDLSNCFKLESFPIVVDGLLDKLKFLNIENCIMLRNFPRLRLTSLEHFNLSCCLSLESFPELLGEMRNIPRLLMDETPIKKLPFSFQNLTQPQTTVSGYGCLPNKDVVMSKIAEFTIKAEEKVSTILSSHVKYICVRDCKLSDEYLSKNLMLFANVKELDLTNNQFTVLPKCIEKCNFLWKLILDDCVELHEIKGIPPCLRVLSALHCISLSSSCKSKLLNQELHEARNTWFRLPRVPKIPEWFDHKFEAGLSISFWFRNKFPAIALCVVSPLTLHFGHGGRDGVRVIINGNTFVYTYSSVIHWRAQPDMYHLHLFRMQMENFNDNMDKGLLENKWNHAEVDFGDAFMCGGIHVLKEKSNMKDIRFTNPENDANIVFTQDEVMLPEPFNLSTELSSTSNELNRC